MRSDDLGCMFLFLSAEFRHFPLLSVSNPFRLCPRTPRNPLKEPKRNTQTVELRRNGSPFIERGAPTLIHNTNHELTTSTAAAVAPWHPRTTKRTRLRQTKPLRHQQEATVEPIAAPPRPPTLKRRGHSRRGQPQHFPSATSPSIPPCNGNNLWCAIT